jgi:hypothetical protein
MNFLALILANLPGIIQAGSAVIGFVTQVRAAASQTGQWTPAMEAQFNAMVAAANAAPEWQTDAQVAAAPAGNVVPAPKAP